MAQTKIAHPFKFPILGQGDISQPSGKLHQNKVSFISLGCPKNQVDSEIMMGNLRNSVLVERAEDADTIVINTCGFIESAKQESIDVILGAIRLKEEAAKQGLQKRVIVTGCLSERYRDELMTELPEVDALFGVHRFGEVNRAIEGHYQQMQLSSRKLLNSPYYAYLKISEGCNQRCGFCYIPMIRGNLVSKTIQENVLEARQLVDQGVKELILVSQDTSSYGYDFDRSAANRMNNVHLIRLLTELSSIQGLVWIRVMYLYPSIFSDDLIDTIGGLPNVCNYVDVPVQHISDHMLSKMRRHTTKSQTLELLAKIRDRVPQAAIRTSLIAGYPGETDSDFQEMCDFVEATQFDRLGVFTYSREEGTPAYDVAEQVPEKVKEARYQRLMQIQQDVSLEKNRQKIGSTCTVVIDRREEGGWVGRTEHDAPEIDNEIMVSGDSLQIGQFVKVKITDAMEYDLVGQTL